MSRNTKQKENGEIKNDTPPVGEIEENKDGVTLDIDNIADDLINNMPDIQEHAIEADQKQKQEEIDMYSHLVDNQGVSFNPDIHKMTKDGEPTISKTGKLMRKPSSKLKMDKETKKSVESQEDDTKKRLVSNSLGKTTASMIFAGCVGVFGDEWQPMKDPNIGLDERIYMEQVWTEYYYATGKTDLPPSMILLIGMTSYATPRLTMPKTQERAKSIMQRFKLWYVDRKAKKIKADIVAPKNGASKTKENEVK